MNIWFMSAHDQPKGQSARTYDYARELARRGHAVSMFTNSYDHWTHEERLPDHERWRIEHIDGIRVIWLRTRPYRGNGLDRGLNMLSNMRRSLQVSRTLTDKPDVVLGPSVPIGTGWMAARIARKAGAAFVFEVRDVWPQALVDDGSLSRWSPVYGIFRWLEKSLYRKADRISAVIPNVHSHVEASIGSSAKVAWVPNGVNFDLFQPDLTWDGGTSRPLTAMYVGGFGAAHDVITIVRAAAALRERGRHDFRFVIIGSGVKREACEAEAKALGLDHVEFLGAVPKARVPELQRQADVLIACVLDSAAYRFGLNLNKLFDYFASARPVVFCGKAPNDPVVDANAGYSTEPQRPDQLADALQKIADLDPAERVAMGRRARAWVESNFDMRALGSRMEQLLIEARDARRR